MDNPKKARSLLRQINAVPKDILATETLIIEIDGKKYKCKQLG